MLAALANGAQVCKRRRPHSVARLVPTHAWLQIDLRAPEEVAEFGQAPVLAGATLITHKRKCVTWLGPIEVCLHPAPCLHAFLYEH